MALTLTTTLLSSSLPGGGSPISIDAIEEIQVVIAPLMCGNLILLVGYQCYNSNREPINLKVLLILIS
jgi:hypothetical protein